MTILYSSTYKKNGIYKEKNKTHTNLILKKKNKKKKKKQTNLSSFPFDFRWFGNRVAALVYIKLFGEGFVLEVWILIKILQERKHSDKNIASYNLWILREPDNSQNLFYIQTLCPQTPWPPPLTSNEVLPRPPLPEELKLEIRLCC